MGWVASRRGYGDTGRGEKETGWNRLERWATDSGDRVVTYPDEGKSGSPWKSRGIK